MLWYKEYSVKRNQECRTRRSCNSTLSDQVGLRKCHLSKALTMPCPMLSQSIFSYVVRRERIKEVLANTTEMVQHFLPLLPFLVAKVRYIT